MNRVLIGVVFLSTFPLFIGDACSYAQETPPEVPRDYDLSRLELSPERRGQVATALRRKDYKKAEEILVAETELDPKSLRAAKLLEFSGGLFFLMVNTSTRLLPGRRPRLSRHSMNTRG